MDYPKYECEKYKWRPKGDRPCGEGILKDGRPVTAYFWTDTNLGWYELYMSTMGLENASAADLRSILGSEEIVNFNDGAFTDSGYTGVNVSANKIKDAANNEMWKMTVIVYDEDSHLMASVNLSAPPCDPTEPIKEEKPDKFLYTKVASRFEDAEYLIGVLEVEGTGSLQLYFINNTEKPIEDFRNGWEPDVGGSRIEAKSFVKLNSYPNWWFDWAMDYRLAFKRGGKEIHLEFHNPKYTYGKDADNIPVMNKKGYVWF